MRQHRLSERLTYKNNIIYDLGYSSLPQYTYTLKPESTGLSSLVLGTILKLKRAQGEIILDESSLLPKGADRCCITFSCAMTPRQQEGDGILMGWVSTDGT